jgi:hypothetical protein
MARPNPRTRLIVLSGLCGVCVCGLLAGAARADPRPVTLAEALAAVARAPGVEVKQHEVAAADALVDAAGVWPSPSVHVQANRLTARLVAGAMLPLPVFGTVGAAQRQAAADAGVERWRAAADTHGALERTMVPAQERAAALSAQAYREGARDLAAVRAEVNAARADASAAWEDLQLAAGNDAR